MSNLKKEKKKKKKKKEMASARFELRAFERKALTVPTELSRQC